MDRLEFHIGSGCTPKGRSRCRRREGPGTTLKPSPVNWGDGGGLGARSVAGEEGGLWSCCDALAASALVVVFVVEGSADDGSSVGLDAFPGRRDSDSNSMFRRVAALCGRTRAWGLR